MSTPGWRANDRVHDRAAAIGIRGSSLIIRAMDTLDRLLTAQDLADYLGVPIATVYAWRHRGHGPPGFRVGRHLRFRMGDVAQWVAKRIDQSDRRRPAEIRVSPGG